METPVSEKHIDEKPILETQHNTEDPDSEASKVVEKLNVGIQYNHAAQASEVNQVDGKPKPEATHIDEKPNSEARHVDENPKSEDGHADEKTKTEASYIDKPNSETNHDDKHPSRKPDSATKNDVKINLGYGLIFTVSFLVSLLSYFYCTNFSNLDFARKIRLQNAEKELSATTIYSFSASDIMFNEFKLDSLKGKVALIVNVASECGFTSQYGGLQKMYVDFKDKGFEILAFPSDQFSQELDTEQEIYDFCTSTFGVTFPMMARVQLNGKKAHPVYKYLTKAKPGMLGTSSIKWNFEKFLLDRKGNVVERYSSIVTPEKLRPDVEALLVELV